VTIDIGWAAPARKRPEPPASTPRAIILQLESRKYAVAVWRCDEDGEAVYEIVHENIRDVSVATLVPSLSGSTLSSV